MWHFTLEGTYIEIRVSKPMPKLDNFLKARKWLYTKFLYKDNISITRKYQKQFEHIFHGYSELSMLIPKEKDMDWELQYSETRQVLERCIHLACNILGFSIGGEAKVTAIHGLERAHFAGQLGGGLATFFEFNKRRKEEGKMAKSKDKGKKETKKKKKVR